MITSFALISIKYKSYTAVISLACFSSAIHSFNSFRLATGSILGIMVLIFYLQKITNNDTRYALVVSILIILCLGINLKKSENEVGGRGGSPQIKGGVSLILF
jgi:divalent metal cation (Fe/Co/Zn/Cd) transporter